MQDQSKRKELLCPSAPRDLPNARVFGVVIGAEDPRVHYLPEAIDASGVDLGVADGISPGKLFRIAATCQERGCPQFDGCSCQLGARVLKMLPTVTEALPPCTIRGRCRWFREHGKSICFRCPGVVTESEDTERNREVAGPGVVFPPPAA